MTEHAYVERWSTFAGLPFGDLKWLSETEARQRFESGQPLSVISVVKRRESDGAVRGEWVIGFSGFTKGVRVQWLNAKHSVWRLNDYSNIDGRLFRSDTIDYAYPDKTRRYGLNECTAMRQLFLRPDGTGQATEDLKSEPTVLRAKVENYRTDNLWMDFPQFSQWDQLADCNFGLE